MLIYITGVPGSGKTYKAVDHIYNNFSQKNKSDKYFNCYTNIDRFRFDLVEQVQEFNYDKFYTNLKFLYVDYKAKLGDEHLILKAKEFKIFKTLFVIDEVHNYLDVNDPVLVWWLSYHRHLYQDLIFITQNLSLIHSKYKSFSEFFYRAHPSSLRLFKSTFKYSKFIDSRMSEKGKAGLEKIKFHENVYALYHSGDNTKAPNIIKKFIVIAIIFLIILLAGGYFFLSSKVPKEKLDKTNSKYQETYNDFIDIQNEEEIDTAKLNLIEINCIKQDCTFNNKKFTFKVFKDLLDQSDSKTLDIRYVVNSGYSTLFVLADKTFLNFIKEYKNEENRHNPSSILPFTSSD